MIHYALRCDAGHEFDGWFRGSAAFDAQAVAGLLACPLCASTRISRAMMAPRLSSGAASPASALPPAPAVQPDAPARSGPERGPAPGMSMGGLQAIPDQVRATLQRLRAEVERKCDYVGPHFADTARAMQDGSQAPRPIYGETTPEQAAGLAEDGIEVTRIPWVPRADG